jgi:hypothetical protein
LTTTIASHATAVTHPWPCEVAALVAPMPIPSEAIPRIAAAQSGPPPRRCGA